jgi:hypothetical protein
MSHNKGSEYPRPSILVNLDIGLYLPSFDDCPAVLCLGGGGGAGLKDKIPGLDIGMHTDYLLNNNGRS